MPAVAASPVEPAPDLAHGVEAVRAAFVALARYFGPAAMTVPGMMEALNLRQTLAWRVLRLCQASDGFAAAAHVPGPKGVRIVLEHATRAGAPRALVEAVQTSTEAFFGMVGRHETSRPALRRLVHGLSRADRDESVLAACRQAFEANSAIYGIRMGAGYMGAIVYRPAGAPDADRLDVAFLTARIDVTRLREDQAWEVGTTRFTPGMSAPTPGAPLHRPMFPTDAMDGAFALIPELCTEPLPPTRKRFDKDTLTSVYEILPSSVGRQGAVTLWFGVIHGAACERWKIRDNFHAVSRVNKPVEHLVMELHVERAVFGDPACGAYTLDRVNTAPREPDPDGVRYPRLDIPLEIARSGRADAAPAPGAIPRLRRARELAFAAIGRAGADFSSTVVSVRYPPIGSSVVIELPLPERSGGAVGVGGDGGHGGVGTGS